MHWLGAILCVALAQTAFAEDYASSEAVQNFQRYLQINSTSDSDLSGVVEFWTELAAAEGLEIKVLEFVAGYPVIIIKWPGSDSSISSVMLNSHTDVVPADEEEGWQYPPFSGYLDADGVIWGRGSQDVKSVSIQYFEALRRIKANNITLLRDVYITLMPDEEVGGDNGIVQLLASEEFQAMKVGVSLDEGSSYDLPISPVFYQDKIPWQIQVDCYGESAHSSTFPAYEDTATGKCMKVINRMMQFRAEEFVKYSTLGGELNAGAYTSVNLNKINAGTANNVIPSHVSLVFDIRLNIALEEETFDAQLRSWIESDNVTLTYLLKTDQSPATLISAENPYWAAFNGAVTSMGLMVLPIVPPGATDARYVRTAGYPSFGFSPMPNTELLLHSVDERLSAETFLRGIDIYETLITALASIPADQTNIDPSVYIVDTTKAQAVVDDPAGNNSEIRLKNDFVLSLGCILMIIRFVYLNY